MEPPGREASMWLRLLDTSLNSWQDLTGHCQLITCLSRALFPFISGSAHSCWSSLPFLAVFLDYPSDFVESKVTSSEKSMASTTASAAALIDTSSSSPAKRMMGSISLCSYRTRMKSRARSTEYMNCLRGFPVPHTVKAEPLLLARCTVWMSPGSKRPSSMLTLS